MEKLIEEWKRRDPFLSDLAGFERYFHKRYPVLARRAEREAKKQIEQMVFALTVPLVVWRGCERDARDEWKAKAKMYRLAKLLKGDDDGLATDYEAMIYISTASLSVPLGHSWYRIYVHLFRQFYEGHADRMGIENVELYEYEVRTLNDLKRWIRKKQRELPRGK